MTSLKELKIPCLNKEEQLISLCENLKMKYCGRSNESPQVYEVEDILDEAISKGRKFYLVKWKGYTEDHNSWEPKANLAGCKRALAAYGLKRKRDEEEEKLYGKKRLITLELLEKKLVKKDLTLDSFMRTISKPNDEDIRRSLERPASKEELMKEFMKRHESKHGKAEAQVEIKKMFYRLPITRRLVDEYQQKRGAQQRELKEWQAHLNQVTKDKAKIFVLNDVDLEGSPKEFKYIDDYRAGEGVTIPDDPPMWCECSDCYTNRSGCCANEFGSEFAYDRYRRVKFSLGTPIYECNRRCPCSMDCVNRVVQQGRQINMCIFRTSNGRGWGVKTMEKIKRNSFVLEYIGEIITSEEAERRGKIYDAEGMTYLFDLDYNDQDNPYTVDATEYGNVAHFINHSCDPNLGMYAVFINNLDPSFPRIAFFAKRDIKRGEELTFDYMNKSDAADREQSAAHSRCSSPSTGAADQTTSSVTDSEPPASVAPARRLDALFQLSPRKEPIERNIRLSPEKRISELDSSQTSRSVPSSPQRVAATLKSTGSFIQRKLEDFFNTNAKQQRNGDSLKENTPVSPSFKSDFLNTPIIEPCSKSAVKSGSDLPVLAPVFRFSPTKQRSFTDNSSDMDVACSPLGSDGLSPLSARQSKPSQVGTPTGTSDIHTPTHQANGTVVKLSGRSPGLSRRPLQIKGLMACKCGAANCRKFLF